MSDNIVSADEDSLKTDIRELVRKTVQETLNALLDEEAGKMVAIGVNSDGRREIVGCAEDFTESRESWKEFLLWLRGRGLSGVRLVTGDKSLGMLGALEEAFPEAKAAEVDDSLDEMKLAAAAKIVREGCGETLAYTEFPMQHWTRMRTNNAIERLNREIRRRTRVVGTFPDGRSALMLVAARLKYIVENEWGSRRYLDVSLLEEKEGGV